MTQHSSGTPDPTGGTGAPPTPVRSRARLPPRRRALAGDDLATGGRCGPARAGRRARPGRPGPRRRGAVRGAGPRRRMATRGRAPARTPTTRPACSRSALAAGPPSLGGAPRRARWPGSPPGRWSAPPPTSTCPSPTPALEIGSTAYTPAVWGSAVNPETKLLLLGHAFESLGAGTRAAQDRRPQPPLSAGDRPARRTRTKARCGATSAGPTAPCATPRCSRCWPRTGRRPRAGLQQRLDAATSG